MCARTVSPIILVDAGEPPRSFLIWGDDVSHHRFLDPADDALDLMAWCTRSRCEVNDLFDMSLTLMAGRAWTITPLDEDAAFAFKMRWL